MTKGGSNYFYLLDAYAGVANLTSTSGATEWTYASDPFGTATVTKNDPAAPTNVMRFDGQLLDSATGLYDLRARTYDPTLGRFLQIDPVPAPADQPYIASYVYASNRPTVMADPSGRSWWDVVKDAVLHFESSYNAGYDELYADWQAGPTAPKVIGGVMIGGALVGLACGAVPVCYAYMSSPMAVSLFSQCGQQAAATVDDILAPAGNLIGEAGSSEAIRVLPGGLNAAQQLFYRLIAAGGGAPVQGSSYPGTLWRLGNGALIGLRAVSGSGGPAINLYGYLGIDKIHFSP